MAGSDTAELETALVNADKAGDAASAKTLAGEITRRRAASQTGQVVAAASLPGMVKSDALAPLDKDARYKVMNQTVLGARMGQDVTAGWGGFKTGYVQAFAPDKAKGDVSESTLHGVIADQHAAGEGKVIDDSYKAQWHAAVASGDKTAALKVYGAYFAHPWKRYEESIEQAFTPHDSIPDFPKVGNPKDLPVGVQQAAEAGTAIANTAGSLINAAHSPGALSMMLNPGTFAYALPFFAAKTWEAVKQAGEDFAKAATGKDVSAGTLSTDVLNSAINFLGAFHGARIMKPELAATEGATPKGAAQDKVDIGKRDETVSKGNGITTAKETAMLEKQQAMIDEWKASKTNPPSDYGIAARVSEERAKKGKIEEVVPGEGVSTEETIIQGRKMLESGKNPFESLAAFQETGKLGPEDIALARAHGEELAKVAEAAFDRFGADSTEYKLASHADSEWIRAIKPMQTAWHKMGEAQQGETELDTGSFHALRRSFVKMTGNDFTPKQAKEAQGISKGVREATDASNAAAQTVFDFLKDLPMSFKDLPAQIRAVWEKAKGYADAGETDYDAMRHKIAQEMGIPVDEVTKNLTEPKSLKKITDEMYRKLSRRRELIQDAKNWLRDQSTPGWLKMIRQVPRIFFIDKIIGHGTVGMVTHAGLNAFDPGAWGTYFPAFFQQFKLLGWHDGGAYHQRMMEDLTRDPYFTLARRNGLANDPMRYTDDYQNTWLQTKLHKMGLTGNRGFDALKLFRQARFNQIWNDMPASMQNADNAKLVADSVNHATGVVKMPFREWASWTFFAPKLEGSRWAWMFGDPAKAAKILFPGYKATPSEMAFAIREVKQKAAIAGTYFTLLAINQGLLSATGSTQEINVDDPKRGDFLAFKAGGYKFGVVGPMLGMVRLLANLLHASMGKRGKVEKLTPRAGEFGEIGESYLRGKLSPFAGFTADVVSQSDFAGRPLPFSDDKVPASLRRQGVGKYSYAEYAAEQFSPIPVSEAIKEVWTKQGMSEADANKWIGALLTAALMGGTGARMSPDTSRQKNIPARDVNTTLRP